LRTINFLDIPSRMNDLWEWIIALDSWDYCDPIPLSELILQKEIPLEFKQAISDIVSSKRKPNKKAAAKLKIPASERMKIAGCISLTFGLIDALKFDALYPEGKGAVGIGAMQMREPIDVLRELEGEQRQEIGRVAIELRVSCETVENILRELRRKIESWPIV
jgi:hypothetical protein